MQQLYRYSKPPVQDYANILETNFRSNAGRSYGYKERIIRMSLVKSKMEAMKFFDAKTDSIATFGSNVTVLFKTLIDHIYDKFPTGHFVISPTSHSATSIPIHNLGKGLWSTMKLTPDLSYDLKDLKRIISEQKQINSDLTISIETVSNVTGHEMNWREVVKLADEMGARVILDNAQGACFVEVKLQEFKSDVFVAVSGHKMGARDGSAVLVGPKNIFERDTP